MGTVEIESGEIIMRLGGLLVAGRIGEIELGFGAFEEIIPVG